MLLPASGAQPLRFASSLPDRVANTGSKRSWSVVDQILIAKRDAEHPLRHHGPDRVLDLRLGATIGEAGGEPSDQTDRPIAPSNSAPASEVTLPPSNAATIWRPSTPSYPNRSRLQLCRHRGAPLACDNSLSQKNYRRLKAPMHLLPVRNPG